MTSNTPAHSRSKNNKNHPYHLSRHGGISDIRIRELRRATPEALKDINSLLPQLSKTAKPLTLRALVNIIKNKDNCLIVAKDGARIVGTGTLIILHSVVGVHGRIENVVVDEGYRGKGLGEKISKKLLALARTKKLKWVELSSRPSRAAANKLYKKLGFKRKETNAYSLSFK